MQSDKGMYILTGQILSQNFQEKPKEDAAHLLWSNDWMDVHCFDEDIKYKDFASHCWEKQDYGINP